MRCDHCGNDYDKSFQLIAAGKTMTVKNAGHFTVTGTYTMNTTGQITVTGTGSAMHVDTSTLTIGGGGAVNIASDAIVSAFEERVGDASGGSVVQSGGSHTISIDGGAGTSLNPLWIAPSVGSTGSNPTRCLRSGRAESGRRSDRLPTKSFFFDTIQAIPRS